MKKSHVSSVVLFLIAILIAVFQGAGADEPAPEQRDPDPVVIEDPAVGQEDVEEAVQTNAIVTHVVDGDTMDVVFDDGLEARIRFLGVNTPETVDPRRPVQCFGKEASDYAKKLLSGSRVLLESDPQADERDKYGRLLRNIFLSDGTDVNATLVREGYAYAYLSFPLDPERKVELKALEDDARINKRGLWNPEACAE